MSDVRPTDEAERLRAAWRVLSGKIMAIVQNHMLGLSQMGKPLTEVDLEMGNTPEFQEGFDGCLQMVTTDYIERLVKAHNEMAEIYAAGSERAP